MKHTLTTVFAAILLCCSTAQAATDSLALQKEYYQNAKQELEDMLDGRQPLSFERAIFLIENAWWENRLDYKAFKEQLAYHVSNIEVLAERNKSWLKVKPNSLAIPSIGDVDFKANSQKFLINWAIYSYMTDTVTLYSNGDKEQLLSLPYRYSYQDPFATNNWQNTQVVNLLLSGKGNCFALASLYKIFADRLNSGACLATVPYHIYITHKDADGIPYNVELSNGQFIGTGSLGALTYTTTDAIRNNIALRELDLKQSIALCLVYLGKGYEYKFGKPNEDFLLSCSESALRHDTLNLNAMLFKAEIFEGALIRKNLSIKDLQKDNDFVKYQDLIAKLYRLGYREMPIDMKNILIKGWQKDTLAYLFAKSNMPEKYNHSGVPNTRYASLSWGLFDEEIQFKPVEQYNRTLFDAKTKKIIKFTEAKTLYNNYNFDPVVFAWSIDPLAHKFPSQSPYSAFGNNPIYNIDVDGAYQYPAGKAAGYTKSYPMLTLYLSKHVQNDIRKSNIVQNAVTKNTHGGYTKSELVNNVAAWGNNSPSITFEEGLAERTGAYGHTQDSKNFKIDAGFATAVEKVLASSTASAKEKQAALTSFYMTLLDETTHTGDLKDGVRDGDEVGKDATLEIFRGEWVKLDDGSRILVDQINVDDPTNKSDFSGTRMIVDRKTEQGKTEVLPTVPQQ